MFEKDLTNLSITDIVFNYFLRTYWLNGFYEFNFLDSTEKEICLNDYNTIRKNISKIIDSFVDKFPPIP